MIQLGGFTAQYSKGGTGNQNFKRNANITEDQEINSDKCKLVQADKLTSWHCLQCPHIVHFLQSIYKGLKIKLFAGCQRLYSSGFV